MHLLSFCALLGATAALVPNVTVPGPDENGRYTLSADGIKAQFIPYGATLTNLWVKDKNGIERDVVLGYDNTSYYPVDPAHPVYNAIPGPYANRIGGGTFVLDGKRYFLEKNDGNNTLHSGTNNWSYRFWSVSRVTRSSITFSIHSTANSTSMPGPISASVTYTLTRSTWHISMRATAPVQRTPLMLTQHTYFNLDAFANPSTPLIWNHTLHLPLSTHYLTPDPSMLPTGSISRAPPSSINDFSTPHQLGSFSSSAAWPGNCGTASNCSGYNNLWLIPPHPPSTPVATLSSDFSGITATLRTDQEGVVLYTCYWMDGSMKIKKTQGTSGGEDSVLSGGCVAVEPQDWVDGVNHPEWGREERQITGPGEVYRWEASWEFGVRGR